ncbi:hypothetical protein XAP412_1420002 [Xanthomonas phaseoli pv. phaseoli]|uniref:Uncharacterized protein n=1 Tax=Xanthomonas campestris pv. phaseoli TaxID=317013 RepID=A0AB38DWH9_XANCH|nr:hypothetical protein XAP6984_1500002 [Xanthomonas phaseoli pv. phaseoli]SON80345.1 hypothetical protein XAP412_1420002 [Xanthomonas phaseoli pv. phaseoli]SON83562.1 hypothetical protein XAP7430_1460002 [Xanthomonas phaseoli pv. phaseoli]
MGHRLFSATLQNAKAFIIIPRTPRSSIMLAYSQYRVSRLLYHQVTRHDIRVAVN